MSNISFRRQPKSDPEWSRAIEQRIRALESTRSVRVGQYVITEQDGQLLAIRPQAADLAVGAEEVEPIVSDLTRGYVTPDQVNKAVNGTSELQQGPLAALRDFITDKWTELTTSSTGVTDLTNGATAGWTGVPGTTGYTTAQAAQAQADAQATLAANAAAIAALQSQAGGGSNSGKSGFVDFSTYPDSTTLPSVFTQTSSGSGTWQWGVQAGLLKPIVVTDLTPRTHVGVYNVFTTDTDYQRAGLAFSSAPTTWAVYPVTRSHNQIRVRSNAAGTTYVYLDLTDATWEIGCVVAGVKTVWYTKSSGFSFKATSAYWIEAGTSGGSRIYRVMENNTVLYIYTEVGTTSQLGASYRYVAIAASNESLDLPGNVLALAFADNTPVPVVGSTFRRMRTTTTAVSLTSGNNLFPSGFFNAADLITPDLTYDSSTNKITVSISGTYLMTVAGYGAGGLGAGADGSTRVLAYKNGSVYQAGFRMPANLNIGYSGAFGVIPVYLSAGDYIQPGYWCAQSQGAFNADAAGTLVWWSLTLLNRSLN